MAKIIAFYYNIRKNRANYFVSVFLKIVEILGHYQPLHIGRVQGICWRNF